LSDPGNADIVADVDFQELHTHNIHASKSKAHASYFFFFSFGGVSLLPRDMSRMMHLVQWFGPISQASFLYNLGLNQRVDVGTRV
jgi:SAM-dependent MidA family methyltransferase